MDRRAFLAVVGGSVLAVPLAAETQPTTPAKPVRLGWLATVPERELQAEFQRAMRDLGHIEGSTYFFDEHYANAVEKLPGAATEAARRSLIVAQSAVAVRAAKQATTATSPRARPAPRGSARRRSGRASRR